MTSPTVEGKESVVRDERGGVRARLEIQLSFAKIYTVRFGETFHRRTLRSQPVGVVMWTAHFRNLDYRCGQQELRADSPYAAYPRELITTLQRLMRWPMEEVTHCTFMGPVPRTQPS